MTNQPYMHGTPRFAGRSIKSRRPDSNRGPLHYECSTWTPDGSKTSAEPALGNPRQDSVSHTARPHYAPTTERAA